MNLIIGSQSDGREFLMLVLEPGNLHLLQQEQPISLNIEDSFPNGIPKKLTLRISYSETRVADFNNLAEHSEMAFNERRPVSEQKRPHCPECRSTFEQLGCYRSEAPYELIFCPVCGCVLGTPAAKQEPK